MGFTKRDTDVLLAACRGTLAALTTDDHLGDAARGYGYESRTLTGDSFETAFEWAREEKSTLQAAEAVEAMEEAAGPCPKGGKHDWGHVSLHHDQCKNCKLTVVAP